MESFATRFCLEKWKLQLGYHDLTFLSYIVSTMNFVHQIMVNLFYKSLIVLAAKMKFIVDMDLNLVMLVGYSTTVGHE